MPYSSLPQPIDELERLHDAFYALDHDWRLIYVNRQAELRWGRTREELLGRVLWDIFPEAVATELHRQLQHAAHERRYAAFETVSPLTKRWMEVRVHPGPAGLSVYARDISERKQAEEALRRQADLLDLAYDAIFTHDLDNRITYWNGGAQELYGYTSAEAIGHVAQELLQTLFPVPHDTVLQDLRETGRWEGELVHTCRDGSQVVVQSRWALQRDEQGQPLAVLEINRDTTGTKQAQEQLRKSEARLTGILESAMDAIMTVDPEQRIVFFNAAAEAMFRCPASEALGKSVEQFIPPQYRLGHQGHIRRFGKTGVTNRAMGALGAISGLRADGEEFPIEASISQTEGPDGKLYTVILRDITEQKNTQERLQRKNERLALLADAAGELLTGKDHRSMIRSLYERVAAHLGVDVFFNFVVNEAGDALRLDVAGGVSPETEKAIQRLEFGQAICGTVALQRSSIHAQHIQQSDDPKVQLVKGMGIRTYVCHPLMVGDRLLGTLSFASRTRDSFGEEEVEFLRTICHYVAAAKERARHMDDVEGLNARLRRAMSETHHRVKNNLQVISGLVDMQVMQHEADVPVSELQRLSYHVRALAAIHDQLTLQAKSDTQLEFISVKAILDKLLPTLQVVVGNRRIRYAAQDARVSVRQSTSLAVLVNELVSNAVKHGAGEVLLSLTVEGDRARLEVCDNGNGFPPGFSVAEWGSTGLNLVESLVTWDLGGAAHYENVPEGGARVVVEFPLPT